MAMEKTLPPEAGDPGEEHEGSARTDGLAAEIAAQTGAGTAPGPVQGVATGGTRGRPPKHGGYSKANGSDGKRRVSVDFPGEGARDNSGEIPAGQLESRPERSVVIPADLLSKVIGEGLHFVESYAQGKIRTVAQAAGLTDAEIAPQLAQAELGERRKGMVAELVPMAMQEHGMETSMSPTTAILLLMAPWGFGASSAYLELAKLAAEKAERDKQTEKKEVKS